MGADRLDFRILGGLSVIRDGGAVEIGRGRLPALLALLVLERHRVVSAESLIDALWDGRPPKTASTVLQGYVSQLRKLLEPGRASGEPPQLLVTEASGYVLHVADEGLDSARFERLLARGRHELASGDAAVAAATLDNALSLWRGPALADFAYDAWAQHEIARLEELRLAAREERIEAQLACGQHSDAVPELERLVREQPLRERVRAQLILALYRSGRQAEALEAYAQTRHRLREDLGVDPTPELQQLYKQVLNQDSAIAAPGRPAPYPQTTLPSPPSRLIGRDQDIEHVAGTLGADDARLVTLIGPGGVGKTRLALAVAGSCRDRYSDGVVFVDLSPVTTPDEAVGLIAQTALESPATEFPLDALIAALRDKETLLLLDNLEQVIEIARPLAEFLASTTKVDLLATSREPLAIRAERRYVVAPLSTEDAVALFLDRASATAPDRAIEADESLVTLCRRLDGLPLALELAAARADILPPKEMLQRHSEHLELLGSGPRDLPERQRSLRATLEWSYNLLGEGDRRLFARLGAFAGGAPLDAIEAVCGAELASLTPLADASLIRVSEGRVTLLETIREYALEQLDRSDEVEAIRRRHIDYFLAFLTDSEHNLINAADPDLIEQVATEHPNILAALSYADPEQRLLITGAVWYFWLIRGYISEARGLIDEALRAGAAVAPEIRRKALRGGAILANRQSDLKVARRYAEEDLRIVQGIGDPEQIARSTSNLGTIATEEGKLDEARVLFERTLSLAREARLNEAILAAALNNLVEVACKTGDYNKGALLAQEAIETSRRIGDGHSLAVATINYGEALLRLGRHQEAIEAINESLEISRRLGDSEGIAYCLDMLGQLSGDLNDWVVAARLLGAASAVFDNLGIKGNALERALRDDAAVRARAGLGAEEFEEAWNDGRSLSLDAAIAEALELTAVLTLPLG